MADIATLIFDIESGPARTAATDLAKLNQAAVKASSGADKLNKTLRDSSGRFVSSEKVVKQYGNEVRMLADRFNPALSAAYKYQQLQLDLNRAVSLGVISQEQAVRQLNSYANAVNKGIGGSSHHIANLSFQLNDIGMMLASGQSPFLLMIQQGPQVAQIFSQLSAEGKGIGSTLAAAFRMILNPVTAITLATIGLGAAFTQWGLGIDGASSKAKSLSDVVSDLTNKVSAFKEANAVFTLSGLDQLRQKYGEVDSQVINLINNQKAYADLLAESSLKEALEAITKAADSRWHDIGLSDWVSGVLRLQSELKVTRADAETLKRAFDGLSNARTQQEQIAWLQTLSRYMEIIAKTTSDEARPAVLELLGALNDATDAAIQLSRAAPSREWMAPAIAGVNDLITLLDSAGLATNIPEGHGARRPPQRPGVDSYGDFLEAQKPKSSGGSARLAQAQKQFQSLRELLEQETLFEFAEWEKRQAQLDNALSKRLLSEQQYQVLKDQLQTYYFGSEYEKAQLNYQLKQEQLDLALAQDLISRQRHAEEIQALEAAQRNASLQGYATLFGNMATIAKAGGDKATGVVKAFSIAQGLLNSYLAFTQVLADPSLIGRPFLRTALAYSTLGAGLAQVAAMRGGGGGGTSAASSVSSAANAAAAQQQLVEYKIYGDSFGADLVEDILKQIQRQQKDGQNLIIRRA